MSTTEEKLQKLKVTELKELLAKHTLVQTGKKDDLIKRLLDNKISLDEEGKAEELAEPASETTGGEPSNAAGADKPISTETSGTAATDQSTLTPEQQAMKARAERFGVPFNPNPTPTNKSKPAAASSDAAKAPTAPTPETKSKSGPIDKANLGIPDETLAKRAARFGLPEKKADTSAAKAAPASKAAATPAAEVTPEQAAKIAEDEEKKRKRAEKFGSVASKPEANGEEPDAKKVKV